MGEVLAIAEATKKPKRYTCRFSAYSENPNAKYLLCGTDDQGKKVFFFRMNVTGLQDRVFGPYSSRSMAIQCFDLVLESVLTSFCEVQNVGRNKHNGMEHVALPMDLAAVDMVAS
jgi:hypothetical protein